MTGPDPKCIARNRSGTQVSGLAAAWGCSSTPEMTEDLIASCCRAGADGPLVAAGLDPNRVIEESRHRAVESQPVLEAMLDWFLESVAGGDPASDG